MGWNGGSNLFDAVISTIQHAVSDEEDRKVIYKDLIVAFQEHDWDTETECMGQDPAFDAALHEVSPDLFEDEEDEDESN